MSPGRFDKKRETSKFAWERAARPMPRGSTTSIRKGTISIGSTIAFDRPTAARSLPITARTAVQLIGCDRGCLLTGRTSPAELRFDGEVDVFERRRARHGAVHGHFPCDEHGDN